MTYELTQRFFFEAAHTLSREVEAEDSRRIHGHTYFAELTVAGEPDPRTGMVLDLARLRALAESAGTLLDHRLLRSTVRVGPPPRANRCAFLWRSFESRGCRPRGVVVRRDGMGDSCTLTADPEKP